MAASSTIRVDQSQFLDPRWRLSNLYTITDKAGRAIPFVPNTAQLRFLDEVHTLNLILKARPPEGGSDRGGAGGLCPVPVRRGGLRVGPASALGLPE
jgi:hypothetical protein